jgi:hypothetical protein
MRKIRFSGLSSIFLSIVFGIGPAYALTCEARYGIDGSSFTNTTALLNLGDVSRGIGNQSAKNKCQRLAINNCSRAEVMNLIHQYAPVGSANFQNICTSGSIRIYYDDRVENLTRSKDGTCNVAIHCTRPPCPPYNGYGALEDSGGSKVVQVKSTSSDLTNCQLRPPASL